jgi:hypothetical protein
MHESQGAGLIGEVERYLAAVAVFRAEDCEPQWQLESPRMRRRRTEQPVVGAGARAIPAQGGEYE